MRKILLGHFWYKPFWVPTAPLLPSNTYLPLLLPPQHWTPGVLHGASPAFTEHPLLSSNTSLGEGRLLTNSLCQFAPWCCGELRPEIFSHRGAHHALSRVPPARWSQPIPPYTTKRTPQPRTTTRSPAPQPSAEPAPFPQPCGSARRPPPAGEGAERKRLSQRIAKTADRVPKRPPSRGTGHSAPATPNPSLRRSDSAPPARLRSEPRPGKPGLQRLHKSASADHSRSPNAAAKPATGAARQSGGLVRPATRAPAPARRSLTVPRRPPPPSAQPLKAKSAAPARVARVASAPVGKRRARAASDGAVSPEPEVKARSPVAAGRGGSLGVGEAGAERRDRTGSEVARELFVADEPCAAAAPAAAAAEGSRAEGGHVAELGVAVAGDSAAGEGALAGDAAEEAVPHVYPMTQLTAWAERIFAKRRVEGASPMKCSALAFLCGAPGAGKSHFVRQVLRWGGCVCSLTRAEPRRLAFVVHPPPPRAKGLPQPDTSGKSGSLNFGPSLNKSLLFGRSIGEGWRRRIW